MKLVAVIGPFTAATREGIVANIWRAKDVRDAVLRLGASPYCAHTLVGDLWEIIPEAIIVPALMEGTRRCDAAILVEGWEHSPGTLREKAELERLGKPVFQSIESLQSWLNAETTKGTP
jgi:hypothetical protein